MDTLEEVIDYFESLTVNMLKEIKDSRKFEKNLIIGKAQNYIDENYYKEINLEMMAEYLKINSTYFCKLFSQVTEETFVDYITRIRIDKAKKYLLDTSLKIYEISDKIGYSSPEYFCRVFKKSMGVSPRRYKEISKIKTK
jgi:two-component system response regulator YesN